LAEYESDSALAGGDAETAEEPGDTCSERGWIRLQYIGRSMPNGRGRRRWRKRIQGHSICGSSRKVKIKVIPWRFQMRFESLQLQRLQLITSRSNQKLLLLSIFSPRRSALRQVVATYIDLYSAIGPDSEIFEQIKDIVATHDPHEE
jgi:hypothetical protein